MSPSASLSRDAEWRSRDPDVAAFFEPRTCSIQYVVADPITRQCALVDPVLDYDERSGSIGTQSADTLLRYVAEQELRVSLLLDTHPHADHLSAAAYLSDKTGAPTGIGERVVEVQKLWKDIYNPSDGFRADGSQWHRLFADGDRFDVGQLEVQVLFSPGHTLASVTYVVGNAAFVHDTLLMPDFGTARCDFPGGSARQLWRTLQRILSLPDETRVFVGHDYMPGGRAPAWESSVGEQRARNIHLRTAPNEDEFVTLREERDSRLAM